MSLTQNSIVSNGTLSGSTVPVTSPVTRPVTSLMTPPETASREPSITIKITPPLVIKEGDCYDMIILETKPNYILGKLALENVNLKLKISKKRTPDSFNGWSEIPANNTKIRIKFDQRFQFCQLKY